MLRACVCRAVGGTVGASSLTGTFLTSTNNGGTWAVDTSLPGYLATGIECKGTACWATLLDENDNSFVAATKQAPTSW